MKNKNIEISFSTLFYCIQALDRYIVEHIEDINDRDKNDGGRNDGGRNELLYILEEHLYEAAKELKEAYEEEAKTTINHSPYEKLVTVHPEIKVI